MSKRSALEAVLEDLHLSSANKLVELVNSMSVDDNDPRVITAALKMLADNGITLDTLHYEEEPTAGDPATEPHVLDELSGTVLPFAQQG